MKKPKTLYSKESTQLTDWLKAERSQSGLSIRQLASKLGWASSIVGKIEQGERRLDVIEFMLYCKAMGADPRECIEVLYSQGKK